MAISSQQFLRQLDDSGVLATADVEEIINRLPSEKREDVDLLAQELVRQAKLTEYQAEQSCAGRAQTLVLGNYTILDRIGKGGMGLVLKALHRRMDRVVALKILSPDLIKTADAVQRFHREVRAAARLEHPNVVAAYDADEASGTHFLVMQFIDGQDLHALVREIKRLPLTLAMDCIMQTAEGLRFAHSLGVFHRDIKPSNILRDRSGNVKILDMGLARLESEELDSLTASNATMGTIDFMSPEQAKDAKKADGRSDIYSLGVTMWFLLTGRPMYERDTFTARLLAHQQDPVPSLRAAVPAVSEELDAIFQTMVAKLPEDRYSSMDEVIANLSQWQTSQQVSIGKSDPDHSSYTTHVATGESTYRIAVQAVIADGVVTAEEVEHLQKLQDILGIPEKHAHQIESAVLGQPKSDFKFEETDAEEEIIVATSVLLDPPASQQDDLSDAKSTVKLRSQSADTSAGDPAIEDPASSHVSVSDGRCPICGAIHDSSEKVCPSCFLSLGSKLQFDEGKSEIPKTPFTSQSTERDDGGAEKPLLTSAYRGVEPESRNGEQENAGDANSDAEIANQNDVLLAWMEGNDGSTNAQESAQLQSALSVYAIPAGYFGLFSLAVIPAPLALFFGWLALRDIARNPLKRGKVRAYFGVVMGVIFTPPLLVFVLLLLIGWLAGPPTSVAVSPRSTFTRPSSPSVETKKSPDVLPESPDTTTANISPPGPTRSIPDPSDFRTWQSTDGRNIIARVKSIDFDDESVVLEVKDGITSSCDFAKLSDDDNEFLTAISNRLTTGGIVWGGIVEIELPILKSRTENRSETRMVGGRTVPYTYSVEIPYTENVSYRLTRYPSLLDKSFKDGQTLYRINLSQVSGETVLIEATSLPRNVAFVKEDD